MLCEICNEREATTFGNWLRFKIALCDSEECSSKFSTSLDFFFQQAEEAQTDSVLCYGGWCDGCSPI